MFLAKILGRTAQPTRRASTRSRTIALFMAMILASSVVACGDDDTTPTDNNTAQDTYDEGDTSDAGHNDPDGNDEDADAGPSDPDGTDATPDADEPDADEPDVDEPDADEPDADEPDTDTTPDDFELIGVYDSSFGGVETITASTWSTASEDFPTVLTKIDSFDNDENFAVTQNAEDAEYSPDAFNKVVWTEPDEVGAFFYCTVDFGLDTAEEAASSEETADASDPATSGCAGFSWTQLTPKSGS